MAKLIIFDMDGTLFVRKNFWLELHRRLGTLEAGERATAQWLTKDYDRLVDIVINELWRGKSAQPFLDLVAETSYMPGVKETIVELHRRGYEVAIITSGPSALLARAQRELKISFGAANRLEIRDGIITGRSRDEQGGTLWPVRADDKVPHAQGFAEHLGTALASTAVVGDDRSDLALFHACRTSIAFNAADPEVRAAATHVVEGSDLRKILQYLP